MNNVIEFPKKTFKVKFVLPDDKVIRVNKQDVDLVELKISGTQGIASLSACSLVQAQHIVSKIFPDSNIHFT